MEEARGQLIVRRDALNTAIAALDQVISFSARPVVELPSSAEARSPRPRRAVGPTKPVPVSRRAKPDSDRRAAPTGPRTDVAIARQDAILAALKRNDGIATSKALRAALPKEAGQSDDQRAAAFSNTMTRLKGKKLIDRTGDTWSLVGLGSERA